jgi:hypothetical protein
MKNFKGSNYNSDLTMKDIAKLIREQLKKDHPTCKFSVTKEIYSMGASIHVSLISADFKAIKNDEEYLQLNQYHLENDDRITDEAKKVMLYVNQLVYSYNYDNSDSMTDYFDTNFYLHLNIGKYNKPFTVTEKKEIKKEYNTTNESSDEYYYIREMKNGNKVKKNIGIANYKELKKNLINSFSESLMNSIKVYKNNQWVFSVK